MSRTIPVHLIAAARPNFMKIAPLYHALAAESWCEPRIVHAGQHYDANMSEAFFRDLNLPSPDVYLGVGSGTHAAQTAAVMTALPRLEERVRATEPRTARNQPPLQNTLCYRKQKLSRESCHRRI